MDQVHGNCAGLVWTGCVGDGAVPFQRDTWATVWTMVVRSGTCSLMWPPRGLTVAVAHRNWRSPVNDGATDKGEVRIIERR